jgi:hypothetical protein
MKNSLFPCLLMIAIIGGCSQPEKPFPQGVWQIVSYRAMEGDSLVRELPGDINGSNIVVYDERHVVMCGRFKTGEDGEYNDDMYGATYTLDGNRYEETYLYHPNERLIGKVGRQTLELRNDTLVRVFPYDENWELRKSRYNIEKFVRVE